ncbi:MAG: GAF domain-containing protein [Chloroflexi bacterium]|nr:GAF domain-containing protein [Chloroflexota bacterium]
MYHDVQRLGREADGLRRIAEKAATQQTADDVLSAVLPEIATLVESEIVAVGLLDPKTGNLIYRNESLYGTSLEKPFVIDIYTGEFNQSPVMARRTYTSMDVSNDDRVLIPYRNMAQQLEIHNTMIIPLVLNQRAMGELMVANRPYGTYDDRDEQLLYALGAQIAAAIERTRLYASTDADLRARVEEQDALDRVSRALNETLLLDRILDVIRAEAMRTTQAEDISVALFTPSDQWGDVSQPEIETRLGGQVLLGDSAQSDTDQKQLIPVEFQVFETNEAVVIGDYLDTSLAPVPAEARSAIVQPIRFGDEVVGLIHLFTNEANSFDEGTISFISRLGQQASLAVSNARRYQDQLRANVRLRRRAHQVQQIFTLSQMLREGADLEDLMQEIAHSVSETVGFDKVTIRNLDEQKRVFRLVAQAGLPLNVFEEISKHVRTYDDVVGLLDDRWKISNSYFFPAERQGESFAEEHDLIDHGNVLYVKGAGPRNWRPDDLLVVPILSSEDHIVGTISVDDPYDGLRPDEETIELLEVFASQAAFILENFRLVENVQQEAEAARSERDRLAQLHLVSSEIQRAVDMSSRLQAVAEGIVAAGWERVQITLRDEYLEPSLLISSGYSDDEAQRLHTKLLPGKIWQDRFNDLEFHDLKLGSAYYLRYDTPWVQKHILRGEPPRPRAVGKDEWHPQDVLYLPLMGHDQKRIIGLIRMESPLDGKRPTEDSLQPIELFALQAAAAIENTRLYSETVRQAEIEQRLNELMEAMASTLDQMEILRALATGLQPFVIFTRMHLAMLTDTQATYFEMTRVELTPDGKVHIFPDNPIPRENSSLDEVYHGTEAKIYDLTEYEMADIYPDLETWSEEGERSVLMVPMIAGGDTLGVLRLGSKMDRSFSVVEDQSLTLIQRMANLSAVSIQNSRLFTSLDESRSFNQAVVQSIQQGIIVLDSQINIRLINAYMVEHYRWDENAVGRNLFAYRPEFRDFLEHSLHHVIETGEELHQHDVQDVDSDGKLLIRNFYTYPLRQGDRVTGAVLLVEDITQRALLEADLSNRAEQLSALTSVSSQMTETLQPDQVVEVVLDALDTVIPYDGVLLWLLDPNEARTLQIVAARGFDDPRSAPPEELINLHIEIEDSVIFGEMAEEMEVVNVSHTGEDPRFPYGEGRPYKSFLAAPLISKGEIIGVLQLEKQQPNFYGEHHEQLVQAFANQAAVALNNAKLFAETQERAEQLNRQAERLTLLNRVSAALSQSLDIENILEITLRETAVALGIKEAAALQINPDDNMCRVVIEYPRGNEEPSLAFPLAESQIIQRIRDTLLPLAIEDVSTYPFQEELQRMMRYGNVASTLFVPMVMSGAVIGLMRFDVLDTPHRFTNDQLDLAQTLSSQAAIAAQNASLYEQSVQRTYQLETLFEAGQVTAGALDVADVMRRVATQMLIALRADATEVMHWDQVENRLIVEETKTSWFEEEIPGTERGIVYDLRQYPLRQRVLRDHRVEPIRIDDENIDPAERAHMEEHDVSNRLLVPLVVNEVAIGLAQIDVRERRRYFEKGQIRLIHTLANQAAIAIENARLQSETRTQIEELYLINDLSKAVSSTVELDELLDQVKLQLPMLTDAQYLYVALYEAASEQMSFPVAMDQQDTEFTLSTYKPERTDEFGYILDKHAPLLLAGSGLDDVRNQLGITKPMFPEARCFLGVPMIAGDEFIGVLALRDDTNPRKFAFNDQRILTTVSAQLAVAIQNANLFSQIREFAQELEDRVADRTRQLEQERQRLTTLYEIASEIAAATLDLDRVLSRTLEAISAAIGASSAIVLAIDDISDHLYVIAQRGLDVEDEAERLQLRQNEGLAGWIIQNRQGLVIRDVQKDPRWITISDRDRQPRSAVATLLESGDDVRGVIMFYSEFPNKFNDDHLRLVTAAASQLANSMNNAELYSLIRDQAERLGAILRQEQVESTKNTAILNSVADGVMYANEKGIIRVFNNTAERIMGLSGDQVLNRPIREITGIYGGRASGWMEAVESWMADPTQHRSEAFIEERLTLEDERVISVRLSPVMMGDQFLGTVSVFRDITREVEVDRLKSEFVATVSHELRTPMTSIKGYADLLLLGAAGEMSEAQQRFLQTIKQNADRLSILVNDLLEVSRIDQGRMPLRFIPVDVNEVVQTVSAHLSGRIKDTGKSMTINAEVDESLPLIRADFDKLVQIMQNIADNAFNYTDAGGTITLGGHHDAATDSVQLFISDTGIGIPEAVQHRVFERFFRGDEHSEVVMDTPGTGLGLAIVKELVSMHGGSIWFKTEPGEGTTFYVQMPVATEGEREAQAAEPQEE